MNGNKEYKSVDYLRGIYSVVKKIFKSLEEDETSIRIGSLEEQIASYRKDVHETNSILREIRDLLPKQIKLPEFDPQQQKSSIPEEDRIKPEPKVTGRKREKYNSSSHLHNPDDPFFQPNPALLDLVNRRGPANITKKQASYIACHPRGEEIVKLIIFHNNTKTAREVTRKKLLQRIEDLYKFCYEPIEEVPVQEGNVQCLGTSGCGRVYPESGGYFSSYNFKDGTVKHKAACRYCEETTRFLRYIKNAYIKIFHDRFPDEEIIKKNMGAKTPLIIMKKEKT